MNTFGDRLRALREARGWSQEKLGFEMEATKATISKWERNKAEPGIASLVRLKGLLIPPEGSLDDLLCGAAAPVSVSEPVAAYDLGSRAADSPDEALLLRRFRGLPSKRKKALLVLLDSEA